MSKADLRITHVRIWTGENAPGEPVRLIDDGAVAVTDGLISYVGPYAGAPEAEVEYDHENVLLTPGLVDCHTHVVYAGNRAAEWQMRLKGASYAEVAKAGGGIVSTVRAVREADHDVLLFESFDRLNALVSEGVTTVEIKSGYGLNAEAEGKMLRVARELGTETMGACVTVRTTHLGAHAMPLEFSDKDAYITDVIERQLPLAVKEGLVDAVDAFCEGIAFSPAQVRRVFEAAKRMKLPVKLHAEQLSNLGGAKLAAEFGALSVDHVEYLDADGIAAIAKSGTVAVLLPGAFYFIKEKQKPPVEALRKAGVPMALATDCNPGSSPMTSILLAMNMGCTLFGLTPEEALLGVTREGARALGMLDSIGTIAVGKRADLCVWEVTEPEELAYRIGYNPLRMRFWGGWTDEVEGPDGDFA
jgi:imidazolonepropionase